MWDRLHRSHDIGRHVVIQRFGGRRSERLGGRRSEHLRDRNGGGARHNSNTTVVKVNLRRSPLGPGLFTESSRTRRPRLPNHRVGERRPILSEFVLGEMGLHVDPAARTSMSCDTGRRGRRISTREKLYSTYEKAIFGVENAVEKNWCIAPIQQLYNRQALRHGPVSIQLLYSIYTAL